jgi:hypothetical protein
VRREKKGGEPISGLTLPHSVDPVSINPLVAVSNQQHEGRVGQAQGQVRRLH